MLENSASHRITLLISSFLLASLMISTAGAQSNPDNNKVTTSSASAKPQAVRASTPTRYQPNPFAGRAGRYYALFWGIDSPTVKAVEAGELIRFTYRVLDSDKAKAINDKKNEAYLIFPDAKIRLSVPSLEKVGQLRQSSAPEAGRTYWMAFSNPGRRVKRGDRVNVVIGRFLAEGLVVE